MFEPIIKSVSKFLCFFKNHFTILKNWYNYGSNKFVIILSILIFTVINIFLIKINFYENYQITFYMVMLWLSSASVNYYHKISEEEILFLRNFYNKNQITFIKILKSFLSYFLINGLIFLFLFIGGIRNIFFGKYFYIYLLLIFTTSLFHHHFIKNSKKKSNKRFNFNSLWEKKKISTKNLPLRGLIIRDIIHLFRNNKREITKIFFYLVLTNTFFLLFIINNNNYEFIPWAIFLQSFIILLKILDSPTELNQKLFIVFDCVKFNVLKAELIFWCSIIFVEILIVGLFYSALTETLIFAELLTIYIAAFFILTYILLIRLANYDNNTTKILLFIMMFLPITIPFTIYSSIKKIRC